MCLPPAVFAYALAGSPMRHRERHCQKHSFTIYEKRFIINIYLFMIIYLVFTWEFRAFSSREGP